MAQFDLFQVAILGAVLLVVGVLLVRHALRGRLDPARECLRCAYPRGASPQARCTECGALASEAPRWGWMCPTRRWLALFFAAGCIAADAVVCVEAAGRWQLYPSEYIRRTVLGYHFKIEESDPGVRLRAELVTTGSVPAFHFLLDAKARPADPEMVVRSLTFSVTGLGMSLPNLVALHRSQRDEQWIDLTSRLPARAADVQQTLAMYGACPAATGDCEQFIREMLGSEWLAPSNVEAIAGGGPAVLPGAPTGATGAVGYQGCSGSMQIGILSPDWSAVCRGIQLFIAILGLGSGAFLIVLASRSYRILRDARS